MITSVRGFRDVFPPESQRLARLESVAREAFARYGYAELRLPTLEFEELFHKATGETTDIVQKEMFTLTDASGRKLALRPEGTPGVVRAMLENDAHKKGGSLKFFCIGDMFRAERPQAGRFRQFEQIAIEYLGNPHPAADAEAVMLLNEILSGAGIAGFTVNLNTMGDSKPECRPAYREELLKFLRAQHEELCEHCRDRIERNPLRALDCKRDGHWVREKAPRLKLCADCAAHFKSVTGLLEAGGLTVELDPFLVRGLDYYTRTVFEFKSKSLGSQDAVAGGGRYDDLVKLMGGPQMPAVGWALGAERALLASPAAAEDGHAPVFVASQGEQSGAAFSLLQELRAGRLAADGGLFDRSLKAQMREADQRQARFVLIVGEEEARAGKVTVKDMRESKQDQLPRNEVIPFLRKLLDAK